MEQRNSWEACALGAMGLVLALGGCPRRTPAAGDHRLSGRRLAPTRWRSVSAGIDHTCAVAFDRSAWCWGKNDRGQVGDTTLADRDRPVPVRGPRSVALIAAGYRRTFALTTTGELWGWGTVKTGGLTRAALLPHAQPRRVNIPEPVRDYRIGQTSCALTRPGNLWCWRGQWSPTSNAPKAIPRQLRGLPEVADFDSGTNHFCAMSKDGRLWCWGQNAQGQLGNGTRDESAKPLRITGLPAVAGVVCGAEITCAYTARGAVWCWGRVGSPKRTKKPFVPPSEPGTPEGPPPTSILRPAPLVGLGEVVSLVLGSPYTWARTRQGKVVKWKTIGAHTAPRLPVPKTDLAAGLRFGSEHRCILDTKGGVRCWGDNAKGQLGDGSFRSRATPIRITGLGPLTQLSVGSYHTCGLSRRGRIRCWGDDTSGQLGLGAPTRWRTPHDAHPTLRGAQQGAAGRQHACAVRPDGDVWCWGAPSFAGRAELGQRNRYTPRRVHGVRDAVAVASFYSTTCALKRDSTVWCWGDNMSQALGRPREHYQGPKPRPVHGLRGATRISVGHNHACAVKRDRTVWCWGGVFHRRLIGGLRDEHRKLTDPPPVQEVFHEAIALASGWGHTCAIPRDGTVWCWGNNRWGNLGDGSRKWLGRPVQVKGIGGARSIAAGTMHSCAVTGDGAVWCWGDNRQGQLGAVTPRLSTTPRRVPGLPKATAVYAGDEHSCALTRGATLWCWGRGASAHEVGQAPGKPTLVPGLRDITGAWLGRRFSCALNRRGTVRCWGDNPDGQLGRRPLPYRGRPMLLDPK